MSISLVVNGVSYDYPQTNDTDWGPDATDWAAAVTGGMLQKSGGLFQLLAEVDFGTSYGVKSLYFRSRTTNVATAGQFRLARADVINWRNQANDADLSLGVSASNILQFNGVNIQNTISVSDTATIDLSLISDTLSADIVAGSITNSLISASAAIAFSKLATLTSGNILVGSAGNVATSVAMSGDITISNAGVTAIGANKVLNSMLAQMAQSTFKGRAASSGTGDPVDLTATQATAILNVMVGDSGSGGTKGLVPAPASGDSAAGKFLKADGVWTVPAGGGDVVGPASSTDNGFARYDGITGKVIKNYAATLVNADINASAAIAYSKLNLSGGIVNADINASAAIAYSKLAALTSANILVGNGSNVATAVAMSGAITIDNAGATTYNGTVPLNKGGTGQTTKAAAFDALSPMTTGGDLIYGGASGTGTRLANGSSGQLLMSNGGTNAPSYATIPGNTTVVKAVTVQKFTSGSGTYTLPSGPAPLYIKVVMVGGGGGGAGNGAATGQTAGGNTTFGSALLTANGGGAGAAAGVPGAGGSATLGGASGINVVGGAGQGGAGPAANNGGQGGSNALGGGGFGAPGGQGNQTGGAGAGNTGAGGGGGANNANGSGAGGGAGGYIDAIITSPSSSYSYAVGAAGSGTTSGAGGQGGAGGIGVIIVYEYYQ